MTLQERANAFAAAFPQFPAAHLRVVQERGRDVLYGTWLMGNDYRTQSALYGAYPKGYLERVSALFPDVVDAGNPDCPKEDPDCLGNDGDAHSACERAILHVFSGSLPPGPYLRLDLKPERRPDRVGNVYDVARIFDQLFMLVFADPPYSHADAEKYGTPMVDRRRALAAIADVTAPGCHLVWLDTVWPMHRKEEWLTVGRVLLDELPDDDPTELGEPDEKWDTVGRVAMIRSTNHRVRLISIFERTAA
jgi:transposase